MWTDLETGLHFSKSLPRRGLRSKQGRGEGVVTLTQCQATVHATGGAAQDEPGPRDQRRHSETGLL